MKFRGSRGAKFYAQSKIHINNLKEHPPFRVYGGRPQDKPHSRFK